LSRFLDGRIRHLLAERLQPVEVVGEEGTEILGWPLPCLVDLVGQEVEGLKQGDSVTLNIVSEALGQGAGFADQVCSAAQAM